MPSAIPSGTATSIPPPPPPPATTATDAGERDGAPSGDPFTDYGDCATRIVTGYDMTVLGGALYDQFGTGSYTGEIDLHDSKQWGSTDVSLASISTIDTAFTGGGPFIELSQRTGSSTSCTPQVRFSVTVHLWSEDGLVDGRFLAHGYWTESPRSVRLEVDEPLSSLGGSLAGTSGLSSDSRFRFSFDVATEHGSATLVAGSAPRFFDWYPFCGNGTGLPGDPTLTDPNAKSCGTMSNFSQASPTTIATYLTCAKNAFASNTPASISGDWRSSGGGSSDLYAPLSAPLAKGRAPYAEIHTQLAVNARPGSYPVGQMRRCQTFTVNTACDMTDGTQVACLVCESPGPWIPMCTLTPPH
jgi:hypothetical protein